MTTGRSQMGALKKLDRLLRVRSCRSAKVKAAVRWKFGANGRLDLRAGSLGPAALAAPLAEQRAWKSMGRSPRLSPNVAGHASPPGVEPETCESAVSSSPEHISAWPRRQLPHECGTVRLRLHSCRTGARRRSHISTLFWRESNPYWRYGQMTCHNWHALQRRSPVAGHGGRASRSQRMM